MPNQGTSTGEDWLAHVDREEARYRDGESRLPEAADADARQRQLTRLGNASAGAGLALLMAGRRDEAAASLTRAAERYRESFADAPPGSWGRSIGAIKARVLAGDWDGAAADARWALEAGAAEADSPIGRYAAALALLVPGKGRRRARVPRSPRRGRLHPGRRGSAPVVRAAGGVPRRHSRCGHRARPAGAGRPTRVRRRALLAAAARLRLLFRRNRCGFPSGVRRTPGQSPDALLVSVASERLS